MPSISLSLQGQHPLLEPVRSNIQSPRQIAMQIFINTLHVLQRHLLSQHHLVECADEERVQESTVEDGQTNDTADKLEVVQMFRINAGVRIDLQGVIIVGGVFEETVERIEHFVGEEEEEFTVPSAPASSTK